MNLRKTYLLVIIFIITNVFVHAQQLFQVVRGKVVEKISGQPLPGVTILVSDSAAQTGTITGINGNFILNEIPVGRHDIHISFIGYKTIVLENILINSGKELVLNIDLEEEIYELENVVVKAYDHKNITNNKMASVSARKFTIEESNKYPSAYGDISRMVVNFPGVQASSNQRNDIIIRGNSPFGLLWRLEGVDIPNPNHFSEMGTSGGVFTIINNNVLSNSDFYTGAFPANYGNAVSGVFDLKMRNGNSNKREYMFQSGFSGLEFGMEGPFSSEETKYRSYLLNYRISTVEFIDKLGVNVSGYVPNFQDLSFKIVIPKNNRSKVTIFGIGGLSSINVLDEEKEREEWTYELAGENVYIDANMGATGITHTKYINMSSRIENTFAISGYLNKIERDSFHITNHIAYRIAEEIFKGVNYSYQNRYYKKINSRNFVTTGLSIKLYNIDFDDKKSVDGGISLSPIVKTSEYFLLYQGFAQHQHNFVNNIVANTGFHFQYFTYNNTFSIEPRLGIKWHFDETQSLNAGLGLHSQIQPLNLYGIETEIGNNQNIKTNNNLDFSRAIHYVLGYKNNITQNLTSIVEIYYQSLYDIPVKKSTPAYSLLNAGANFDTPKEDSLFNDGTGRNYGIELSLQKYLSDNYYFLISTTLFESKYKGYDRIERNTAFNTNFIINLLGGFEHKAGKNNLYGIDIKTTWAGGKRYVPIDVQNSTNKTRYDWDNAYNKRRNDYFTFNSAIYFKLNRPKYSLQIMADFQNMTNHKNIFLERYDPTAKTIRYEYQLGFLPTGKIKIEF